MTEIRLMIADDHSIMRDGLKLLLESEENFQVIAESDNSMECLHILSELKPDLLILDIHMSDQSGFDLLYELNQNENRNIKVLILTDANDSFKNLAYQSWGEIPISLKKDSFLEDYKRVLDYLGNKSFLNILQQSNIKNISALIDPAN